jgi:hypothetical protein
LLGLAGAVRAHSVGIDIFFPVGKCILGGECERGGATSPVSKAGKGALPPGCDEEFLPRYEDVFGKYKKASVWINPIQTLKTMVSCRNSSQQIVPAAGGLSHICFLKYFTISKHKGVTNRAARTINKPKPPKNSSKPRTSCD